MAATRSPSPRDPTRRRLLILLFLPQSPTRKRVKEIHDHLAHHDIAVDRRQIQRDMEFLAGAFPVVCDDEAVPGWSWAHGAQSRLLQFGLDIHAAIAFMLAETHLKPLLPRSSLKHLAPYFQEARRTLAKASGRPLGEWENRTHLSHRGIVPRPPEVPAIVETLSSRALVEAKKIRVTYERHDGVVKVYVLSPLGLLSRGNTLYLVAKGKGAGEVLKTYAMHRIRDIELLSEPAEQVPEVDVAKLDREGQFGILLESEPVEMVLRFTADCARAFRESRYANEQEILEETETHVTVRLVLPNNLELRWWIQGYGNKCEVLLPLSLAEEIAQGRMATA